MAGEMHTAGLSEAVCQALLRAELDGNLGRYFARFISVPAGRGLIKAGLGAAIFSGVMLNSEGERLRAILLATPASLSAEGER